MKLVPIPLYHGTSTLFLDGIVAAGLGGIDPIKDWKIHDFASELYPLVQEHFSGAAGWMVKAQSFGFMVEKKSEGLNYQHGDTYLSPSLSTAVRYAVNKRFGSELLTYSLDFLSELVRRKVPGVADDLYRKYPHIFGFLDISCAPVLIEVRQVPADDLLDEFGLDPDYNLDSIDECLKSGMEPDDALSQTNFRLRDSIPSHALDMSLINVTRWDPFNPQFSLYPIAVPGTRHVE